MNLQDISTDVLQKHIKERAYQEYVDEWNNRTLLFNEKKSLMCTTGGEVFAGVDEAAVTGTHFRVCNGAWDGIANEGGAFFYYTGGVVRDTCLADFKEVRYSEFTPEELKSRYVPNSKMKTKEEFYKHKLDMLNWDDDIAF